MSDTTTKPEQQDTEKQQKKDKKEECPITDIPVIAWCQPNKKKARPQQSHLYHHCWHQINKHKHMNHKKAQNDSEESTSTPALSEQDIEKNISTIYELLKLYTNKKDSFWTAQFCKIQNMFHHKTKIFRQKFPF